MDGVLIRLFSAVFNCTQIRVVIFYVTHIHSLISVDFDSFLIFKIHQIFIFYPKVVSNVQAHPQNVCFTFPTLSSDNLTSYFFLFFCLLCQTRILFFISSLELFEITVFLKELLEMDLLWEIRKFKLYWLPPRVFYDLSPGYSICWIFFKQLQDKIIELCAIT